MNNKKRKSNEASDTKCDKDGAAVEKKEQGLENN
jgi:hypothetical protein